MSFTIEATSLLYLRVSQIRSLWRTRGALESLNPLFTGKEGGVNCGGEETLKLLLIGVSIVETLGEWWRDMWKWWGNNGDIELFFPLLMGSLCSGAVRNWLVRSAAREVMIIGVGCYWTCECTDHGGGQQWTHKCLRTSLGVGHHWTHECESWECSTL